MGSSIREFDTNSPAAAVTDPGDPQGPTAVHAYGRGRSSLYYRAMRAPRAMFGVVFLVCLFVALSTGAAYEGRKAMEQDLAGRLKPLASMTGGSWSHPLGTDNLGRDVLARLIAGGRTSLWLGASASLLAGVLGVAIGVTSGFYSRTIDAILMGVADIQLAFPSILLALAVLVVLGPGLLNLIGVLMLSNWVMFARVVRAEVLSLKRREFTEAARALGATDLWVLSRHIFVNVVPSGLVLFSLTMVRVILAEAALSFLGLGVPPPNPTLGGMLSEAQGYLTVAWWLAVAPGLALTALVLVVSLVADGLRDLLDPTVLSPSA